MRWFRSLPSQVSTSWPRGANVIYAVIILSFSAASINSSPSSSPHLKQRLNTPPASTTHFSISQLTISEFASTSLPLPATTNANPPSPHLHNGIDDDSPSSTPVYSNQFVLEIQGGEDAAKSFATTHGFIYLGQVSVIVYAGNILLLHLVSSPSASRVTMWPLHRPYSVAFCFRSFIFLTNVLSFSLDLNLFVVCPPVCLSMRAPCNPYSFVPSDF